MGNTNASKRRGSNPYHVNTPKRRGKKGGKKIGASLGKQFKSEMRADKRTYRKSLVQDKRRKTNTPAKRTEIRQWAKLKKTKGW
jgi:hypothetical protein